jgi:hypothetical protein
LQPGKVYELRFNLKSTAYVVPAGHRIRASISSSDFQNVWPTPKAAVNTVFRGHRFPSRIILPVVSSPNRNLPKPAVRSSPNIGVKRHPGSYNIAYDRLNQQTTVDLSAGTSSIKYRISDADPAQASVEGIMDYTATEGEREIRIRAKTVTSSDEQEFRHSVSVEIAINGEPHFNKEWASSVPRRFN